jgi:molecular chaperone DnaK
VSSEIRDDVNQKVEALKSAVAANNAVDMQSREQELTQALQKIGEAIYSQGTPGSAPDGAAPADDIPPAGTAGAAGGGDGDVVDAEFKEV